MSREFYIMFGLFIMVCAIPSFADDDNPYRAPTPVENPHFLPEREKIELERLLEKYNSAYDRLYGSWNFIRLVPSRWLLPITVGVGVGGLSQVFFTESVGQLVGAFLPLLPLWLHARLLRRVDRLEEVITDLKVAKPDDFWFKRKKYLNDCRSWTRGFLSD